MAEGRVMIAATGSGSGKTIISCALMRALKNKGLNVLPYKCGPDYIDPMYHRIALNLGVQAMDNMGRIAPGGNLDTYFTDDDKTVQLLYEGGYVAAYDEADDQAVDGNGQSIISVIEGVMGLYDGLGGTSVTGSSYELATVIKTPIILIVPAKGVGGSVLATIKGFLDYDEHKLIEGIILNRINKMYYVKLKQLIEDELGIAVIGYVPDDDRLHIGSRHLGLITPTDAGKPDVDSDMGRICGSATVNAEAGDTYMTHVLQVISTACEIISDSIDMNSLIAIAEGAEKLTVPAIEQPGMLTDSDLSASMAESSGIGAPISLFHMNRKITKMAIAMDEAFCFYYRENLRYLKSLDIKLIPFSPLHDEYLPEGVDAIYLGGGYPEEYLDKLSTNKTMKAAVKAAADNNVYIIAECGGFMYLQEAIEDKQGRSYNMTGVIPGRCKWQGKLTRFGYVRLNTQDTEIKGHEFHYYDSDYNGEDIKVIKASTGKEYTAMYDNDKMLAGFVHLYYSSVKEI